MDAAVKEEYGKFIDLVFRRTRQIVERRAEPTLRGDIIKHLTTLELSKGFRPAIAACAARITYFDAPKGEMAEYQVLDQAVAVQMVHEATLIVDDIIDDSPARRHAPALHTVVGAVVAGAAAAELNTLASEIVDINPDWRSLLRETGRKIAVAEAMQDRDSASGLPYSLERWHRIADGDTCALIYLAAGLGGLEKPHKIDWIRALGALRHGLDDIDDLLDERGDQADVRMRVPTLPACFCRDRWERDALRASIPQSLNYLNGFLAVTHPPEAVPFFADFAAMHDALDKRFNRLQTPSKPAAEEG